MTRWSRVRGFAVCLLVVGCGTGGATQDGIETGSCIQGACTAGLVCVADVCVAQEQADGSGGMDGSDAANGSGATDASSAGSVDGGPPGTSGVDPDGDPDAGSADTGAPDPESTSSTGVDEGCNEGTDPDDCAGDACSGEPAASPAVCDPWMMDCADGEKCTAYAVGGASAWNALGCFPVDCEPVAIGETCQVEQSGVSGIDNCETGSMCWAADVLTFEGYCAAFCTGSLDAPSCPLPDTVCVVSNGGVLPLCRRQCDPLLQSCAGNEVCIALSDVFVCSVDASGVAGAHGDPCSYANACDHGNACIDPEAFTNCASPGCCSTFCDVFDPGSDAMCASLDSGQSCVAWWPEGTAPDGYDHVGVCSIPA